jgi:hypothetical protein
MEKLCKNCGKEFVSVNNKGSEQIYCSKECRTKSANERFKNNLINKYYERANNETRMENDKQSINGMQQGFGNLSESNGTIKYEQERNHSGINSNIIDCIKEKYEADVSTIFFKLKCEQLEKEVAELKQEIIQLEMEIDELSMEENESTGNNILSGIMTEFKKDPQSTVSFASELITNFMKPKKTA